MVDIREAVVDDCLSLKNLIQELADYEKMSSGPKLDVDALQLDGFGPRSFYRCAVAETRGEGRSLVGYALFFPKYNAQRGERGVYMEDLYVSPTHRGKGLGTKLWAAVNKWGLEHGATSCGFCVLDWNAPSIAFYHSKGAADRSLARGAQMCRLYVDKVSSLIANVEPAANVTVRQSNAEDVPAMQAMLGKLSAVEDSSQNTTTNNALAEAVALQLCEFVVATDAQGRTIGLAEYHFTYSTFEGRCIHMGNIFVEEQNRGKGIGSNLLKTVLQRGVEMACTRFEFNVSKNNKQAVSFFKSKGAVNMTEAEGWHSWELEKEHMIKFCK